MNKMCKLNFTHFVDCWSSVNFSQMCEVLAHFLNVDVFQIVVHWETFHTFVKYVKMVPTC